MKEGLLGVLAMGLIACAIDTASCGLFARRSVPLLVMGDGETALVKDVLEVPAASSRSDNNRPLNSFCDVKIDLVSGFMELQRRQILSVVSHSACKPTIGLDQSGSSRCQRTSRFDCLNRLKPTPGRYFDEG